jgi:type II secretory pathway pseudopilin PulG
MNPVKNLIINVPKNSFSQQKNKQKILARNFLFRISNGMKRGFTMVEMLVIIGVLALLSATLILYSHVGERQIILINEQARILTALYRAKSLAINTFGQSGIVPCGYGVHFETSGTFLIFKDLASNCSNSDRKYSGSGSGELYESFQLNSAVKFDSLTLSDVLFIPPDPLTVITPAQEQGTIIIKPLGAENSVIIKINSAGQIST